MEKETWRENKSEEEIKEIEKEDARWRRDQKIKEIKKEALDKVLRTVISTMDSTLGRTRTLELMRKGLVLRNALDYLKNQLPMQPWLKKSLEKKKQAAKNDTPDSEVVEPLSPEEEEAIEPINEAIKDFNEGVDGLVESSDEEIDKL